MIIEFIYKGRKIEIQCNENEKLKEIFQKFSIKIFKNLESLFFLYNSKALINDELKVEEILNEIDKNNNKIVILANEINNDDKKSSIIKSKNIICPKCGEIVKIKIDSYKITYYECKNGHIENNVKINEFNKTQNIDISKIICYQCKTNKSQTYENSFFRCNTCKYNICPLCKSEHNKTHKIINYDEKDYICEEHNERYISYCESCKKNLCLYCQINHMEHIIIGFGEISRNNDLDNKNNLKEKVIKLRKNINKIKEIKEEISKIFSQTIDNLESFYNFYEEIINNYNNDNKRYEIYNNIINLNKSCIIEDINYIINENHLDIQFNKILNIYYNMNSKNTNEITINYKVNKNDKKIIIFSKHFVENNLDNCLMEINGKTFPMNI